MDNKFTETVFTSVASASQAGKGKIVKNGNYNIKGKMKIEVMEESHDGVKIVLNKDENDRIREIKFICSCGQTKSLFLDYDEEN
jgi:hypothetical protein